MKKVLWGYSTQEVDSALETLSNQNAALIQHNDYMEDEMKSMRSQLDEAKAAIAAGMTQADADGYKELKFAYAALQEKAQKHEEEIKKAREEAAEEASQAAKQEAESARAQLEQIQTETSRLTASKEDEVNILREQMDSLRSELSAAKQDAEASAAKDAQIDALKAQMDSLKAQMENHRADYEQEAGRISAESEVQLAALREELSAVKQEAEQRMAETSRLTASKEDELNGLKSSLATAQEELSAAKYELQTGKSEFAAAQEEIARLKREAETHAAELANLTQKNNAASASVLTELGSLMDKMVADLKETKAENHDKMIDAVDDFSARWTEANTTLDGDLDELETVRAKSERDFTTAMSTMLSCYRSLASNTKRMQSIMDEMDRKRSELETDLKNTADRLIDEDGAAQKPGDSPNTDGTAGKSDVTYIYRSV